MEIKGIKVETWLTAICQNCGLKQASTNLLHRKLCPQCGQDNWEVVCLNEVK